MVYDPRIHHRRSIRLQAYDYASGGAYFVTMCTANRRKFFGKIESGEVKLFEAGGIVKRCWEEIQIAFPTTKLDVFVVMPDHFHSIIMWDDESGGLINQTPTGEISRSQMGLMNQTPTGDSDKWILMKDPRMTLGKIIRHFKARTAKLIHDAGVIDFKWQRNYYEHIIRNAKDLKNIQEYILNNPLKEYGIA